MLAFLLLSLSLSLSLSLTPLISPVLASAVILGVFVYISYLYYLNEEHDVLHSYAYGYGVTLEVGAMEHVTVLTITVLGGVSVLGHVVNTCLACCCHGDVAQ